MACSGFITMFKVELGIRSQGCISKTSILKNVKIYHSTTENWIKVWNASLYLLFLCYLCHIESLIFNTHFGFCNKNSFNGCFFVCFVLFHFPNHEVVFKIRFLKDALYCIAIIIYFIIPLFLDVYCFYFK